MPWFSAFAFSVNPVPGVAFVVHLGSRDLVRVSFRTLESTSLR